MDTLYQNLLDLLGSLLERLPVYLDPLHLNRTGLLFLLHIRDHEGCRVSELAHALRMDKAAVTRGLVPLGELGYIEKQRAKIDTRTFNLYLTPAGRLILHGMDELFAAWDGDAARALGQEEYAGLCASLSDLRERMKRGYTRGSPEPESRTLTFLV